VARGASHVEAVMQNAGYKRLIIIIIIITVISWWRSSVVRTSVFG